jgi:cation:H+ antiporter
MEYLLLLTGFALLLFGGKYLVTSGVALAVKFNMSPLVVGLTIVSFSTSAPELFVSLIAAIKDHPEVAMGNVIGSNIANVALVLALTALIIPIPVRSNSVKIDAPFMLAVSILLWVFILNNNLSRAEGLVFVLLLIIYICVLIFFSAGRNVDVEKYQTGAMKLWKILALFIIADAGLLLGSELLVNNASLIATDLGVSERVIAITVVAFGTSLPELATSVIAAFKKQMDISIGNILGSNIFNILAVLGITGMIQPIPVSGGFLDFDIFWMFGTSLLLFIFILPFKGGRLTRSKAAILIACYGVYIYMLYFSGR